MICQKIIAGNTITLQFIISQQPDLVIIIVISVDGNDDKR